MPGTPLTLNLDLPTIRDDGAGYSFQGRDIDGFADDLRLPTEARAMIARFASALTPDRVTPEQRSLLRGVGPSSLLKDLAADETDLENAWQAGVYELLTPRQRALLREPSLHPDVTSTYPLSISDVSRLSGATERQLRYWEENGLLHSGRASSGSRRYFRSAVLRAMAYEQAPQHVRQTLVAVLKEGPERFLRLLTAALPDRDDLAEAVGALLGAANGTGAVRVDTRPTHSTSGRRSSRKSAAKRGTGKRRSAARTTGTRKATATRTTGRRPKTSAKRTTGTQRKTSAKRTTATRKTTSKRAIRKQATAKRTANKQTAAKRKTAKRSTSTKRTTAKRTTAKRSPSGRSGSRRSGASGRR
jgi:hypothetical protein